MPLSKKRRQLGVEGRVVKITYIVSKHRFANMGSVHLHTTLYIRRSMDVKHKSTPLALETSPFTSNLQVVLTEILNFKSNLIHKIQGQTGHEFHNLQL